MLEHLHYLAILHAAQDDLSLRQQHGCTCWLLNALHNKLGSAHEMKKKLKTIPVLYEYLRSNLLVKNVRVLQVLIPSLEMPVPFPSPVLKYPTL